MANEVFTNEAAGSRGSYVCWSAIIGGALLAATYSLLLLTFGGAVGLSLVSPFEQSGSSQTILLIAAALWLIWVQVSGFALGGYVAGRMRPRLNDASEHEVEMRDGVHGLLVWATGVLLGAFIAVNAAASVIGSAGQAATAFAYNASPAVSGLSSESVVDALFRPNGTTAQRADDSVRSEAGRIVGPIASGKELTSGDRTYLAQLIASNTGLTPAEASTRIDDVVAEASLAAKDAKRAAVIIGFITAASLLLSAVAAWWAADLGGDHRDSNVDFSRYTRWRSQSGRVAFAPASGKDDLTRIKGIGPALKRQLYGMKITTFEQIANFTQDDIDRVNESLSFPGRIEREHWVEQAKRMAHSG